ncbi:MAG: hypothetical protein ACAI35_23685, partial [Candidatus Methylacidiphilales bacterium]
MNILSFGYPSRDTISPPHCICEAVASKVVRITLHMRKARHSGYGTYSNTSAVNSIPTTDLLRDVSGIVVAIAVMDEEGRKMSSSLSSLIASL